MLLFHECGLILYKFLCADFGAWILDDNSDNFACNSHDAMPRARTFMVLRPKANYHQWPTQGLPPEPGIPAIIYRGLPLKSRFLQ